MVDHLYMVQVYGPAAAVGNKLRAAVCGVAQRSLDSWRRWRVVALSLSITQDLNN
jgi:hypothetical protein